MGRKLRNATTSAAASAACAVLMAALLALDPRNITLEPEYYADVDPVRFARVKPLLWLWYSFDRSPAGGQNVDLGVRLRRLLAPRIFARCGRNFKCFQHVEFSFGYNLEVGDDVVVHRHVLLDDRDAREGLVSSYIHTGGRVGVLIEVNCETDFVARTDEFQKLVRDLAIQVAGLAPRWVDVDRIPAADLEAKKAELAADPAVGAKPAEIREKIVEGILHQARPAVLELGIELRAQRHGHGRGSEFRRRAC